MKGLVDSHSHLQFGEFDADREAVLERARAAGVEAVVVLGTDVAASEQALALADFGEPSGRALRAEPQDEASGRGLSRAERFPGVMATVGCHPHDASSMDEDGWRRLEELLRHPLAAAVGEIGLDFYRNLSPRETQIEVFRRQLELAAQAGLPVVIHCRDAHEEMEAIVTEWADRRRKQGFAGPLGVMHYFSPPRVASGDSGDVDLARRYAQMGFLISIHGSVTFPRSERLRQVAAVLPLESLVLETDAPYGAPQSRRGQRNEPAYLVETAEFMAKLRGEAVETVARVTGDNARRLFRARAAGADAVQAGSAWW